MLIKLIYKKFKKRSNFYYHLIYSEKRDFVLNKKSIIYRKIYEIQRLTINASRVMEDVLSWNVYINLKKNWLTTVAQPNLKHDLSVTGIVFSNTLVSADSPEHWQLYFQDPASPIAKGIHDLHHDIVFILLIFLGMIIFMIFKTTTTFSWTKRAIPDKFSRNTKLEIAWTLFPVVILGFIALPSLALIYAIDDATRCPKVTIKVIGHQWYWTYEYTDFTSEDKTISYDSYLIPEDDLTDGELRLLEVDNRLVVPINTCIRILVTASDVIHSWAVPSLGIKVDAVPGRLNVAAFQTLREGVYYGQCSELCGTHHGFMPIVVESVSEQEYSKWLHGKL